MFFIRYLLIVVLIAIPYCLLAGWDTKAFPFLILYIPGFLYIWFMMAIFIGLIQSDVGLIEFGVDIIKPDDLHFEWCVAFGGGDCRVFLGPLLVFWALTVYGVLPIILRWSAALLNMVGYETVSSFLYVHRYMSLAYAFMGAVMLVLIFGVITIVREAMEKACVLFRIFLAKRR